MRRRCGSRTAPCPTGRSAPQRTGVTSRPLPGWRRSPSLRGLNRVGLDQPLARPAYWHRQRHSRAPFRLARPTRMSLLGLLCSTWATAAHDIGSRSGGPVSRARPGWAGGGRQRSERALQPLPGPLLPLPMTFEAWTRRSQATPPSSALPAGRAVGGTAATWRQWGGLGLGAATAQRTLLLPVRSGPWPGPAGG